MFDHLLREPELLIFIEGIDSEVRNSIEKAKERYSRDDIAEAERFFKYVVGYEFKGALAELKGERKIRIRPVGIAKLHYWEGRR